MDGVKTHLNRWNPSVLNQTHLKSRCSLSKASQLLPVEIDMGGPKTESDSQKERPFLQMVVFWVPCSSVVAISAQRTFPIHVHVGFIWRTLANGKSTGCDRSVSPFWSVLSHGQKACSTFISGSFERLYTPDLLPLPILYRECSQAI